MNAIRLLTEAKIPVVINASMIPENACDLEKIVAIGKELGLNTRVATYMFPPMRREKETADSRFTSDVSAEMFLRKIKCQYSPEEYMEFAEGKLAGLAKLEECDDVGEGSTEFMRCRAGRCSFWVNWEGEMTACGMMNFPMVTKPFEEPFRDCWMRLTDAVRTTPVLNGCTDCDKRDICHPCVAMIYGETGTIDQKAPYLCNLADRILEIMKQEREENLHE